MKNHQLINQNSNIVEYYTPQYIIECARNLLGTIDLDPASSSEANEIVKAVNFYTKEDDGLLKSWYGRVWMNHPFSRKENKLWINKLIDEYEKRHILHALCITYASTSEQWFQPLLNFPICFISGRVNFISPHKNTKSQVTKGSCITYIGDNTYFFFKYFRHLGKIHLPFERFMR